MDKIALILVVESSENNKGDIVDKYDTGRTEMPYEEEAIMCVKMWRKNGGDYANIPIYAININDNPPSKVCQKELKNMGVIYIENYIYETKSYPCGYYNVPLACKMLERELTEDKLIHIDLDMYLLRPPTKDLLYVQPGSLCKIAINEWRPTDNLDEKELQRLRQYPFEIETNFMVSKRMSLFYDTWYRELKEKYNKIKYEYTSKTLSIFEERICDIMYFDNRYPFEFFKEGYQLNHEKIIHKDAFFLHCHMDNPDRFNRLLKLYLQVKNREHNS